MLKVAFVNKEGIQKQEEARALAKVLVKKWNDRETARAQKLKMKLKP